MMLGARLDKADQTRANELIRQSSGWIPMRSTLTITWVCSFKHTIRFFRQKSIFKGTEDLGLLHVLFSSRTCSLEKNDKPGAIHYLETYLDRAPGDPQANNNLLLLYIDTNQPEKARALIAKMKQLGLEIPEGIEEKVNSGEK